jgi:hypothetical protein
MMKWNIPFALHLLAGCALASGALLGGCASTGPTSGTALSNGGHVTVSDPTRRTRSGFLSDYARLKDVTWSAGVQCWSDAKFEAGRYDKIMITRMAVSLKPDQQQTIDPTDLKTLTDYFHDALVKALQPGMQVVTEAGSGVLVLRIALTDLVPTEVAKSVTGTLIPYGFVAEAGAGSVSGRPAGSTSYLGETGIEMQLRDGASSSILAECRDTEIGRKYAAELDSGASNAAKTWVSGYMNSFESWAYARNAFDKWAALTAQRLTAMRDKKADK